MRFKKLKLPEHQVSDLFNAVLAEWEQLPLVVFTLGQGLEAHALPDRPPKQAALLAHVVNLGLLQPVHPPVFDSLF